MSPPGVAEGDAGVWSPCTDGAYPRKRCSAAWLVAAGGTQARSLTGAVFLETSAGRAWHTHWAAMKEELQKMCK